jgi:hypothetical protein
MKIGVRLSINVNEIQKEKLFKGKKGNYLDLVTFIEIDKEDNYGNNGFITQKGDKGESMPILGNTKVFWKDNIQQEENFSNSSSSINSHEEIPF